MAPSKATLLLALGVLNGIAIASPAPVRDFIVEADAMITPFKVVVEPTKTLAQRGILSEITAKVNSALSALGSDIPAYVESGQSLWMSSITRDERMIKLTESRHTQFLPGLPHWRCSREFIGYTEQRARSFANECT
jgi:hypothetical protein